MNRQRPVWQEAYDAQMGLWRWYRTPRSHEWLTGLFRDGMKSVPEQNRPAMATMYDAELGRIIDCDPIYVSADMCELVDVARQDFQPEPLIESDLPTPRGFVYLAKPVGIFDRLGYEVQVRALAWSHQYVSTFDKDDDAMVAKLVETMGGDEAWLKHGPRFTATEADALVAEGMLESYGVNVGLYSDVGPYLDLAFGPRATSRSKRSDEWWVAERKRQEGICAGTPIVPIHLCPWHYGMEFVGNEVDLNGEPTGADQWWKLLQTTLRLMQQRLTSKGFGRPERARRREAARLGFPPDTEVVIVRLRGEEQPRKDPTGEEANYSHRFIVGGHWRNQWYPSEKVHRQIRIAPYVKGPEDKPLIVRPRRVFQWTR